MVDLYEKLEIKQPDYQSTLRIALREHMKNMFMRHFSAQAETVFSGSDYEQVKPIIGGSTNMMLLRRAGHSFPLPALKSGDIDILVDVSAGCHTAKHEKFASECMRILRKRVENWIAECGFQIVTLPNGNGNHYPNSIMVECTFPPEQVRDILRHQRYDLPVEERSYKEIMEIELVTQPYLSQLPSQIIHVSEIGPVRTDVALNLLGSKIARSLFPKAYISAPLYQHGDNPQDFKPRDMVDIYNLAHASPPLIAEDCETLKVLRLVTLIYIARYGKRIETVDMHHFDSNDSHALALSNAFKQRVREHSSLDEKCTKDILETFIYTVRKAFPEIDIAQGKNKIVLSESEQQFFNTLDGFQRMPNGAIKQITPSINIGLLTTEYGDILSKYAYLADAIQHSASLEARVHKIEKRREATADF